MLSFPWVPAVREKRYPQDCAHAKGSFRRMCDVGLLSQACNKPPLANDLRSRATRLRNSEISVARKAKGLKPGTARNSYVSLLPRDIADHTSPVMTIRAARTENCTLI